MKSQNSRLTIIDDDRRFLEVLSLSLRDDFIINAFYNHRNAVEFIKAHGTDAVLLDVHLDDTDGFSVCRKIKAVSHEIPVLFFTGDADVGLIDRGFEEGGIDLLSKNTSFQELTSRISNRIKHHPSKSVNQRLQCGDVELDPTTHLTYLKGAEISLTPKEFDLLKALMERPEKVFSKRELLALLWKDVVVDANNIDTHIFHLRHKIKGSDIKIENRKGFGYILRQT
ncbi:MAG TPA: response regulator transcription factor [Bacteriovoracaceae bacterium]|nr:response regulator transcription factor [Bacteriovoracaceae bacterium]